MGEDEIDLRPLHRSDRHPAVFRAYAAVTVGESVVLLNDHDPRHLHDEFEVEYPGGYGWAYLDAERGTWRIQITKRAATPLPRVVTDATAVGNTPADATGAIWKLTMRERDLDSNVIALAPGTMIGAHDGPDLDVLIYVLAGSGRLGTELGTLELRDGTLCWLPRRSRREFTAGPDGLKYLTVHQRRQALPLLTTAPASAG
jgi:uncharacterized protein (DUF2249 family)